MTREFWNKEYQTSEHLALSAEPSEDLQKFVRFVANSADENPLGKKYAGGKPSVVDLGTGNGRNLLYLAEISGCRGTGYDISDEAISMAKKAAEEKGLQLSFEARSIAGALPFPDASQDLVLDMMTSHFLAAGEREKLRDEIARILKPAGWLFFKTFLADEDLHVKRLLRDHPGKESGTYIHPEIGVAEHVFAESELQDFFGAQFDIKKIDKSHKHMSHGHAWKRRTVSVYLERKW